MKVIGRIKKYWKLLCLMIRVQLMSELEYRINFIAGILVEIGYFLAKLSYVFVVIQTKLTLGDFGPYHIVTCIGVYIVLTGIYMFFWPALKSFPEKVQSGSLDLLMVKPISTFFIVSCSKTSLSMFLPNFILGWLVIIYGWYKSGEAFILSNLILGLFYIFTGTILTFCFFFIPPIISFWVIRIDKMNSVLASLWDFNNMPMNNYPEWLQKIGLYIIPVFVITNPAAFTFLNHRNIELSVVAVASPVVFCSLLSIVWNQGIKRYHSATS